MKILSIVISSVLLVVNDCNKKQEEKENQTGVKSEIITETKSDVVSSDNKENEVSQNKLGIAEYEATSRGFFLKVTYNNGILLVFKDRNNSGNSETISLSKSQQEELNKLLQNINPETLEGLQAPTGARLYDGAAHANLTIKVDEKIHSCPGFDHGKPPVSIEKFVSKLLSYTKK